MQDEPKSPALTEEEKAAIVKKVKAKILLEEKEAEKKKFEEALLHDERMKLARSRGTPSSQELVKFHLFLPKFCKDLIVDGEIFVHKGTYVRPRSVVDSLAWSAYKAWEHQFEVEGKKDRGILQMEVYEMMSKAALGLSVLEENVSMH